MKTLQSIRRKKDFKAIYDHGSFVRGSFLNLWFKKKAESGDSLILAVVVSRKTEPLATNRNTWRRRIREVLRRKNFKAGNSFFLIIQVKKKGKISSSEEIEKEIFRLFREAGGEEV